MKDYNQIKNYSINYYLRYYPSKKRLEEKLVEKFSLSQDLLSQLLTELSSIIVEEEVIQAKINNLINKGKNVSYIKNNLLQKKYCKQLVLKILEEKSDKTSILSYDIVLQKVQNYFEKNKSKKYVYHKLVERSEDAGLVEECIREVYEESDVHLISSIYYRNEAKYNLNNNVSRQKFIASMMNKGFKYGDIKDFLSGIEPK